MGPDCVDVGLRPRKEEVSQVLHLLAGLTVAIGKASHQPLRLEDHPQQVIKTRLGYGLMAAQLKKVHSSLIK